MICEGCGFDNEQARSVCVACDSSLDVRCGSCQSALPVNAKFCPECGAPAQQKQTTVGVDAERRRLTVMFIDLVDSTPLSSLVDTEHFAEIIDVYQTMCRESVTEWGGFVSNPLGDGLLVYFGYPMSQEDAGARAIRAGLTITKRIGPLSDQLRKEYSKLVDFPLRVRVGIHSGLAVIGELGTAGTAGHVALGETLNIAARLEGIAGHNQVVVSDATLKLAAGMFFAEDLGTPPLKGVGRPIRAHRILGATGIERRTDSGWHRPTQLIGRDAELQMLVEQWQHSADGSGQAVVVSGEAGIGKSRLLSALRDRLESQPHVWLESHCVAHRQETAFFPIIELLDAQLGIRSGIAATSQVKRLEECLEDAGLTLETTVPLLAPLFDLSVPDRYSPSQASRQLQRRQLVDALATWLLTLGHGEPLLLTIEDLHWCDSSTVEVVQSLLELVPSAAILVILVTRPEGSGSWKSSPGLRTLDLGTLSPERARQFLIELAEAESWSEQTLNNIVEHAGGVPLFLEELARSLVETPNDGSDAAEQLAPVVSPDRPMPQVLSDLLGARLDRLDNDARQMVLYGSVIGRDFDISLLGDLLDLEPHEVTAKLDHLCTRGIAERFDSSSRQRNQRFRFRHALVQDAAFDSMLRRQARAMHQSVADTLLDRYPIVVQSSPEVLARHLQEAGAPSRAARFWRAAGEMAMRRNANAEASAHFEKAVDGLANEGGRYTDEYVEMVLRLAGAYRATKGYASDDIRRLCAEASEVARDNGDRDLELQALVGLYSFHLVRAENAEAARFASMLLETAKRSEDQTFVMIGNRAVGAVAFHRGDQGAAQKSLGFALDSYEKGTHASLAATYGSDHAETCAVFLGLSELCSGATRAGSDHLDFAVSHSEEIGHIHSLAQALSYRALLSSAARDWERVRLDANRAHELSVEHGLKLMEVFSECSLAAADVLDQPTKPQVDALLNALDLLRGVAGDSLQPYYLTLAAEVVSDVTKGMELCHQAERIAERTDESWWRVETRRTLANLQARAGDLSAATNGLSEAIDLARNQGAGLLALRACVDLASLEPTHPDLQAIGHFRSVVDLESPSVNWDRQRLSRLAEA